MCQDLTAHAKYIMNIEEISTYIEEILDVDLPDKMASRGRSFTSENNGNDIRWLCLQCGMESNIGGIGNHQKKTGHIGKQRKRLLG